ncbi:hypothetical protein Psi01_25560 [Planobispora siamensis]|uniref:Uncharacterized protein n=2 Tax=Planobispora siamensis TaxID=936338 RepID=A0A8J3SG26_9ACTN|nr:hypothetical protein Psi01_25560 [Planobispora siamensis]
MVLIGNVLIYLSLAPALAFVAIYFLRVDWRRSEMSRHVMAFMAVITALLMVAAFRQVAGEATWFKVLRLVVFSALPYVLIQRLWLLIKAQGEARRERQREGGDRA